MKKSQAVKAFGNQTRLALALGISKSAVCQWEENLSQAQADRIIGAALRMGIDIGYLLVEEIPNTSLAS
ncbi:Cro/CI family transcriptional regulator [Leptospirillum ferriphilum]|uniref:Cro/CI family transcriptional regulator n=1 Tax=Leptospirillum ferriphilum TaxID=178606 RepID=UPI000985F0AB